MNTITAKVKAAMAAAVLLVALAIGAVTAWWLTSTRYDADIANLKAQHSREQAQWEADKAAISKKAQQDTDAALNRMKAAQDALASLDAQKSKELADAEAENNSLRNDVASGAKRVRILETNLATAQRAASQHTSGGSASAGCVGDGGGAELSTEAGQLVLDLRAGIIRKEAQLNYLQSYVRDVVRQCKR